MKMIKNLMVLLVSITILQCCSAEDPFSELESGNQGYTDFGSGSVVSSGGSGELTAFTVELDKTSAEPTSTATAYVPDSEDEFDSSAFTTEVNIVFNGSSVSCDAASGVAISANGAHVTANHEQTKAVCYVVSGQTSNGSLTIVGDKKYAVRLAGADITNPDSTALNLLSKKRAFVVLQDGTTNRLTDGSTSKDGDQKAALYCKGKLLLNGSGSLEVYGNYNNAVHCADYIVFSQGNNVYAKSTAGHGIKANDGIYINGGIVNVEVSAEAAKGINCESNIVVNGGRTTVITTGNGTYEDGEAKGSAAVKCDSTFTMNGGELLLKSTGSGGKGLKSDWEAYVTGGVLKVITTGSTYSYNRDTASPKGVKVGTKNVHGLLNISGGTVMVRTSGSGGEGIESKGTLTISDNAQVQVSAYDDAINSAGDMYVMGGDIVAVGTANDGLDANGNMYISGGRVVAFGAGGAESGIDTSEQTKLYITGGQVFGIGGRIDASFGSTDGMQAYASASGSVSANSTVTVSNGSTTLASFTMPPYSTSGTILVSAPGMANGSSYTLNLGSSSQTVTATTSSTSSGMGGNTGWGGGPGGGRR